MDDDGTGRVYLRIRRSRGGIAAARPDFCGIRRREKGRGGARDRHSRESRAIEGCPVRITVVGGLVKRSTREACNHRRERDL